MKILKQKKYKILLSSIAILIIFFESLVMRHIKRLLLAAALMLTATWHLNAETNPKPFVIPELKEWKGAEGTFTPTSETRIVYPKGDATLERIANQLAGDYKEMFGKSLTTAAGKAKAGDIGLALKKDKSLGSEGYTIKVSDRVAVTAPTPTGVYWATRSLLQMSEQSEQHPREDNGVLQDEMLPE